MNVNVIVAGYTILETDNIGIGYKQKIPWYIPEDIKYFKEITEGGVVIMGRKTYESIPTKFRPLKNRLNIVISTTMFNEQENLKIFSNLKLALEYLENTFCVRNIEFETKSSETKRKIFIIGGESLYNEIIDSFPEYIDKLYFTSVDKKHLKTEEFDTFFPLDKYKKLLEDQGNIIYKYV